MGTSQLVNLMSTTPSILCVTHQISRKNRNDLIDSIQRYKMMNYKVISFGTSWNWYGKYLVVLGQYGAALVGTWWYWVSVWRY